LSRSIDVLGVGWTNDITNERGSIAFTEVTQGYRFSGRLQGCTNSAATFGTWNIVPGTYEVTVSSLYSNIPGVNTVVASKLTIP
jgi:hypothetical protein